MKRFFQPLLLLSSLALLIWLGILRWPRQLDVVLGSESTHYRAGQAGIFVVALEIVPEGNDNGPATILVWVNGRLQQQLPTTYNYDFFSDIPAGTTYRWWIDDDWQPDVLILSNDATATRYFVSSRTGQIQTLTK